LTAAADWRLGQRHQAHAHQRLRITWVLLQHALVAERSLGQMAGQLSWKTRLFVCIVIVAWEIGLKQLLRAR